MEIEPTYVDLPPKDQPEMTDTDTAYHLIDSTFVGASGRDVKVALVIAFTALKRREARLPKDVLQDRPRAWTGRRVRALYNREARRVDHYEIQDLTAVAVEEAKNERRRLQERDDRMAAFLAAHEAGENGEGSDASSRSSQRLDRARIGTTDADESADQSHWGR